MSIEKVLNEISISEVYPKLDEEEEEEKSSAAGRDSEVGTSYDDTGSATVYTASSRLSVCTTLY